MSDSENNFTHDGVEYVADSKKELEYNKLVELSALKVVARVEGMK